MSKLLLIGVLICLAGCRTAWAEDGAADPVADAMNGLELLAGVGALATTLWAWFKASAWFRICRQERYKKAVQALEAGVDATFRSYVQAIKEGREDGKLTREEMRLARKRAKDAAVEIGKTRGVDVLTEIGSEYLDVLIARIVKSLKSKAAAVLLVMALLPGLIGCATYQWVLDDVDWSQVFSGANVETATNLIVAWREHGQIKDREEECIDRTLEHVAPYIVVAVIQKKPVETIVAEFESRGQAYAVARYPDLMAKESFLALATRVTMRRSGMTLDEAETIAALLRAVAPEVAK